MLIVTAAVTVLAACGGDGPSTISYNPPPARPPTPTPTPTPVPAIIPGAKASQEFSVQGAAIREVAFPEYEQPTIDQSEQLRIRYDAAKDTYEVLKPDTKDWQALSPSGSQWFGGGVMITPVIGAESGYSYSSLANWYGESSDGFTYSHGGSLAFGAATEPGAIPISGSATYSGSISGITTETWNWGPEWGRGPGGVSGDINLSFDFGAGALAGSIKPHIWAGEDFDLPEMNFIETVFSKGSTTFSGRFDTKFNGANGFSGMFTGPQANELIGNFLFPYKSPLNGNNYEAGGAFIAKH